MNIESKLDWERPMIKSIVRHYVKQYGYQRVTALHLAIDYYGERLNQEWNSLQKVIESYQKKH